MFRQFLDSVDGNQGYLITSLAIFLLFFIGVAVLLLMMKKEEVNYMSKLPLNDDEQ